jgi:FKBP-type peptidyl-prolyl cis-trans isomerase
MRIIRSFVILAPLAFSACLSGTETSPVASVPIDCETLATTLTASEPTLTTTASGLKFRDVTVGTGTTVATGRGVAVHYSGCLTTGTKFDENTNTDNPLVFTVGEGALIKGFDEGVTGMKVGGRRQLVIPPTLGYGATPRGAIPANSTLVFTIDVVAAQ